ncbi:MAG: exo-alpha-sialidase [Thermoleophilaceae bacterium]|nr:exo-alpha-sialidase [Thermoleophilaceae bacterium]
MEATDIREPPAAPPDAGGDGPATKVPRRPPWWLIGAALFLFGAGALVVSTAFESDPSAERLGPNAPVNAGADDQLDISAHNSPTLVRNPANHSELAVANRIDTPRYSCALHLSTDAGATWEQRPLPLPAGEEPKCYAPDVAFGRDGTLYLSFVTLKGFGNVPNAVWMSTSTDGGRTLSTPRKLLGKLSFQTRLVADPAKAGRLYLTWLDAADVALYKFTSTGNPIRTIRSDDGGKSWSEPAQVSDAGRMRVVAPTPQVGPRGELYVLYLDLGEDRLDYEGLHEGRGGKPYEGNFSLVLARSRDGGENFEESVVDSGVRATERFITFIPPAPSLAVDQKSGRLYAAFEDARFGDPDAMVWSRGSSDSSWSGPVRVNDTRKEDGRAQYRPRLSVAPNGRLDVVYYDRRSDPEDRFNEVSLQSSFDDGKSFIPRVALSDRSFDSRIGFGSERGMPDIGSRLASLSTEDRAFAVWTDTRAGTDASGKQDLMRAVAVFSDPAGLESWQKNALRYGGLALMLVGLVLLGREGAAVLARRRGVAPSSE